MNAPNEPGVLPFLNRFLGTASLHLTLWGSLAVVIVLGVFATSGMVVVEKGEIAILISKTGEDLPDGEILAVTGADRKGIQLEPLPEGWHWRNPYHWDWVVVRQTEIKTGQVGVKVRNFGRPLPPGRVIAEEGEKGVVRDVLRPGRYVLNTLAYTLKIYPAIAVEPGHVGMITLVSGKEPVKPNEFLVEEGERGVQKRMLPPGTYYPNPFIEKITPIDIRAHRFDMIGDKIIKFPSLDGFDISMEGTIEWYINPERVPEVFVKYADRRDIVTCLVETVILPNARALSRIEGSKHLARDFIGGITREKFQDLFLTGLKRTCEQQGILIQSALVRQTTPPEAITKPIKEREIAIRTSEMYSQQMEREKQQRLLSMEEKMKERKTIVTLAQADVSVAIVKATQEKEVAIIEASRQLDVATLQLTAAKNMADAKIATGKAKADVIVYKNAAEAQGLKNSVTAFGAGDVYVRYLMNMKLAPAIGYILSNTDGPFAEMIQRALEGGKPALQKKN